MHYDCGGKVEDEGFLFERMTLQYVVYMLYLYSKNEKTVPTVPIDDLSI